MVTLVRRFGDRSVLKQSLIGILDDRVRAISLAMGMNTIMWTRTATGGVFDTNGELRLFRSAVK
jgi:hypothetical protein